MTDTKVIDISHGVMAIGERRRCYSLDQQLLEHLMAQSADVDRKPERRQPKRELFRRARIFRQSPGKVPVH